MGKRDDIQVKSKPKTYNRFVSPNTNFEFEIDIMEMESKDATSNARYCLVAAGNFNEMAEVVHIKNRTPEAMIDGLKKIFTSMGQPRQLYSDEKSSMRSAKMNRCLSGYETKAVQTTTHAHTVERFIGTFKDNLNRRLDSLSEETTKWITHEENNILNIWFN